MTEYRINLTEAQEATLGRLAEEHMVSPGDLLQVIVRGALDLCLLSLARPELAIAEQMGDAMMKAAEEDEPLLSVLNKAADQITALGGKESDDDASSPD